MLKTRAPGEDWELLVVGVPGDREVDLKRIAGQLEPVEVERGRRRRSDEAVRSWSVGYIGPQRLAEWGVRYFVDPIVVPGQRVGDRRERAGQHAAYVVRGRDFEPAGELGAVEIRDGDRCARCGGELSIARGIEIGHIFQLGRKYADVFELDAQGPDGESIRITMGSYGVGVSRAVAAVAEQTPRRCGAVLAGRDRAVRRPHRAGRPGEEQLAAATKLAERARGGRQAGVARRP